MPGYGRDCASNRLLDMLGNPPIILLFEIADSNDSRTRSYSEFCLGGRPANECCRSIDTEEDESGLVACRGWLPY